MAKTTVIWEQEIRIKIKPERIDCMLVILTDEQLISPKQVCQTCLMANRSGLPRWHKGKLNCGHVVNKLNKNQAKVYECQMGFRVADID